jgi:hypothetical protein
MADAIALHTAAYESADDSYGNIGDSSGSIGDSARRLLRDFCGGAAPATAGLPTAWSHTGAKYPAIGQTRLLCESVSDFSGTDSHNNSFH